MPQKKTKTPEQIQKANLNRVLNRLKVKVAEKEEIWLEMFQDALPLVIQFTENQVVLPIRAKEILKERVLEAALIADWMLDEYEERWGKVAE